MGEEGARRNSESFEKCTNALERARVLIELLWVKSLNKRSLLCLLSIRLVTGAGPSLLSRLDAAAAQHTAEIAADIATAHGNTGRSPINTTSPLTVNSILRIVARYVEWHG